MAIRKITRRQAITAASAGALGTLVNWSLPSFSIGKTVQERLAINGGTKVHAGSWPAWPVWDQAAENNIVDMLRSGKWWRGNGEHVAEFEKKYAELMGIKRCLATASGTNFRMQQIQALILMSQMNRILKDADVRLANAMYLDERLEQIPGIIPYKLAEGIPCSSGYGSQNKDGLIEDQLNSKGFKRLFSESRLKQWREENVLPGNDKLCKEAVIFYQSMLLGSKSDMDDIVKAIAKIYENRASLVG